MGERFVFVFGGGGEKLFTCLETNNTNNEWRHISVLEKGFVSGTDDSECIIIG